MDDFLSIINDMEIDKKIHSHILHVAKDLDMLINEGKDPLEWLDFLLGFYQAVPKCQQESRAVIMEALEKIETASVGG